METYVVDTSGWIEYFRQSKVGEKIRQRLIEGEIITPTVVLGEFRKKYVDEKYDDAKFQEDYQVIRFMGEVVGLSSEIAIRAGEMRATCGVRGMSLVDCIVLTLAESKEGKAISTDKHFKGQKCAIYFPVEV